MNYDIFTDINLNQELDNLLKSDIDPIILQIIRDSMPINNYETCYKLYTYISKSNQFMQINSSDSSSKQLTEIMTYLGSNSPQSYIPTIESNIMMEINKNNDPKHVTSLISNDYHYILLSEHITTLSRTFDAKKLYNALPYIVISMLILLDRFTRLYHFINKHTHDPKLFKSHNLVESTYDKSKLKRLFTPTTNEYNNMLTQIQHEVSNKIKQLQQDITSPYSMLNYDPNVDFDYKYFMEELPSRMIINGYSNKQHEMNPEHKFNNTTELINDTSTSILSQPMNFNIYYSNYYREFTNKCTKAYEESTINNSFETTNSDVEHECAACSHSVSPQQLGCVSTTNSTTNSEVKFPQQLQHVSRNDNRSRPRKILSRSNASTIETPFELNKRYKSSDDVDTIINRIRYAVTNYNINNISASSHAFRYTLITHGFRYELPQLTGESIEECNRLNNLRKKLTKKCMIHNVIDSVMNDYHTSLINDPNYKVNSIKYPHELYAYLLQQLIRTGFVNKLNSIFGQYVSTQLSTHDLTYRCLELSPFTELGIRLMQSLYMLSFKYIKIRHVRFIVGSNGKERDSSGNCAFWGDIMYPCLFHDITNNIPFEFLYKSIHELNTSYNSSINDINILSPTNSSHAYNFSFSTLNVADNVDKYTQFIHYGSLIGNFALNNYSDVGIQHDTAYVNIPLLPNEQQNILYTLMTNSLTNPALIYEYVRVLNIMISYMPEIISTHMKLSYCRIKNNKKHPLLTHMSSDTTFNEYNAPHLSSDAKHERLIHDYYWRIHAEAGHAVCMIKDKFDSEPMTKAMTDISESNVDLIKQTYTTGCAEHMNKVFQSCSLPYVSINHPQWDLPNNTSIFVPIDQYYDSIFNVFLNVYRYHMKQLFRNNLHESVTENISHIDPLIHAHMKCNIDSALDYTFGTDETLRTNIDINQLVNAKNKLRTRSQQVTQGPISIPDTDQSKKSNIFAQYYRSSCATKGISTYEQLYVDLSEINPFQSYRFIDPNNSIGDSLPTKDYNYNYIISNATDRSICTNDYYQNYYVDPNKTVDGRNLSDNKTCIKYIYMFNTNIKSSFVYQDRNPFVNNCPKSFNDINSPNEHYIGRFNTVDGIFDLHNATIIGDNAFEHARAKIRLNMESVMNDQTFDNPNHKQLMVNYYTNALQRLDRFIDMVNQYKPSLEGFSVKIDRLLTGGINCRNNLRTNHIKLIMFILTVVIIISIISIILCVIINIDDTFEYQLI